MTGMDVAEYSQTFTSDLDKESPMSDEFGHPSHSAPDANPYWDGQERRTYPHAEPSASEGEDLAWTADPGEHLGHAEPAAPEPHVVTGPLPVCDYTGDGDAPCEEPVQEKRWSSAAVIVAASLGALVGGVLVAAAALWLLSGIPALRNIRPTASTATTASVRINPSATEDRAVAVASKAQPSVVNISLRQAGVDPFTGQRFTQASGNGSGVIIRPDGYILTNNHVVEGASEVIVTYGNQNKVARVVGTDPLTDLAVIKIDGSGYPAAELGTSKGLKVGQFVLAIGSPFGLDKTVTGGIISALQRSESAQGSGGTGVTTYTDLIQTDAAINPGNSGGALVDETGKLIGINTLIATGGQAQQSAGVGFAIPIDFASQIADQLIKSGKATHPYMGVSLQTVDDQLASQLAMTQAGGALVRFVDPGSPAESAGLKRGDVIVRIGEREIVSTEDVFAAVRQHKVGESVPFDVVRGEQTKTVNITLGSDRAQ
jgi:putative serine protease PepD